MLECRKCGKPLQEGWVVCPWCTTPIAQPSRKVKARGNGQGTAYKRERTWTAKVIIGWRTVSQQNGSTVLRPISKTKGGFKTKSEALAYCSTLLENPSRIKGTATFAQVHDRWKVFYEKQNRIKPTTMAGYEAAYKHFAPIQYLQMNSLTTENLQDCINECPKGRSTLNDMKTVASLIYKYAVDHYIVDRNLASNLYTSFKKKGTHPAITVAELQRIKEAVGIHPYADYVYFLCYTGFRPNEFLSLKKSAYTEVECNGEIIPILIGGFKTEAGTDRCVTISPKIQSILKSQMDQNSEYIFPNKENGQMMDDEFFREKCFNPLMEDLKITNRVPYSCRHTFANLLKNVMGSDTDKAELIGHADAAMTKYYQSADYESMKRITDSL